MGKFNNTIDSLGHDVIIDGLIDGTITEFKDEYLTSVGAYGLSNLGNLTKIDLLNVTEVKVNGLSNNALLDTLILRSETFPILTSNMVSMSKIANRDGYIYIPKALMDIYKTSSYTKIYADQYRALEDYTIDGTITGELDESKI